MEKVQLGRTGLMVTRTAFGALPIQRADFEQAKNILCRAFECGQCRSHCPYELDTPALLKKELRFYRAFLERKGIEPVDPLAKS